MNTWQIILIIAAIVAVVFGIIYGLFPFLIKKGVNVCGIITAAKKVLKMSDAVVDTAIEMLPNVGAFGVVDKIIEWAQKGVDAAEQMYKSSQLEADERKQKATEIVYACLEAAGIDISDADAVIVDGMIEAAVKGLEKTGK